MDSVLLCVSVLSVWDFIPCDLVMLLFQIRSVVSRGYLDVLLDGFIFRMCLDTNDDPSPPTRGLLTDDNGAGEFAAATSLRLCLVTGCSCFWCADKSQLSRVCVGGQQWGDNIDSCSLLNISFIDLYQSSPLCCVATPLPPRAMEMLFGLCGHDCGQGCNGSSNARTASAPAASPCHPQRAAATPLVCPGRASARCVGVGAQSERPCLLRDH